MLKITRLDTGTIVFEKKNCQVSELISHSVNDLTTRAKSESKQIQIEGDEMCIRDRPQAQAGCAGSVLGIR